MTKRLRRWFRQWLDCRRHRCSYYQHYLVYGPADLSHEVFHTVERQAEAHMATCRYEGQYRDGFRPDGKIDLCPVCVAWERRVRA
jgi:CRISPR/Cas system Type II protein with McrA/HNH and RuvC-like nuclease domain